MKTFVIEDKVRINNPSAPKIHNRIGVIRGYNDMLDLFKLDIDYQTYMIKGCYLEKVNEEELIKKCLFENADAFDEPILTFKNGLYIKTIKSKDFEESEEKKMKEIKNQKVVDLYFKRKEKALEDEFDTIREKVKEADRNYIFIKQHNDQINEYIKANEIKGVRINIELPLTEESVTKRDEAYNDYRKKIDKLNNLKDEVLALLSGCDTYEQEIAILRSYDIVTNNNKLV
jgi:hypothetical protein